MQLYNQSIHWNIVETNLNFPCLSARSEERQERSTEYLSKFTLNTRQWIVIPGCEDSSTEKEINEFKLNHFYEKLTLHKHNLLEKTL